MSSPRPHNGVMRVLVAEDHAVLAGRIAEGLRDAGLAVDVAGDGAAALNQAGLTAYDVIVLDRDLPVVHGDRVCRTLAGGGARILMLTAAAGVDDRAGGPALGSGARMIPCPGRSPSPSWSRGCARWAGGPRRRRRWPAAAT